MLDWLLSRGAGQAGEVSQERLEDALCSTNGLFYLLVVDTGSSGFGANTRPITTAASCMTQIVEVWRVCFNHHKACRRLVQVGRVCFLNRKVSRSVIQDQIVRFDHRKACWRS